MKTELFFGALVFFASYFFFRKMQKKHEKPMPYSDVLTNENYKVKGQWEK